MQTDRDRVNEQNGRILKPLLAGHLLVGAILVGLLYLSGHGVVFSLVVGMLPVTLLFAGAVQVLAMFGVLTRLDSVEAV